jgi:hypothetical protein
VCISCGFVYVISFNFPRETSEYHRAYLITFFASIKCFVFWLLGDDWESELYLFESKVKMKYVLYPQEKSNEWGSGGEWAECTAGWMSVLTGKSGGKQTLNTAIILE